MTFKPFTTKELEGVVKKANEEQRELVKPMTKKESKENWSEQFDKLDWRIWDSKTSTYSLIPEINRNFYKDFIRQTIKQSNQEFLERVLPEIHGRRDNKTDDGIDYQTGFNSCRYQILEKAKEIME